MLFLEHHIASSCHSKFGWKIYIWSNHSNSQTLPPVPKKMPPALQAANASMHRDAWCRLSEWQSFGIQGKMPNCLHFRLVNIYPKTKPFTCLALIITKKNTSDLNIYTTKNGVGKMPSWNHFRFEHTPKNVGRKQLYIYIYCFGELYQAFSSLFLLASIGLYIVFKIWSVTSHLHLLSWSNVAP